MQRTQEGKAGNNIIHIGKEAPAVLEPSRLVSEGSNSNNTEQITLKSERGVVRRAWRGSSDLYHNSPELSYHDSEENSHQIYTVY